MRQGICALCSHNEVIQAAAVDFIGQGGQRPVSVTTQATWSGSHPPLGILNMWVCRRCGFTQWFAFEPEKVPLGEEYSTRLIRGTEQAGPYR
jgi:hypothetical protein